MRQGTNCDPRLAADYYGCNDTFQDNNQQTHNLTSKLMRIFKSKKWKQKTKYQNNELLIDKPLSFPKVKLRKNTKECHKPEVSNPNLFAPKVSLHLSKSLPVRKPSIVWQEIQEFQKLIPDKKSVGTQTSISCDKVTNQNTGSTNQSAGEEVLTNQRRASSQHRPLARTSRQEKKVSLQLSTHSRASFSLTNQKRASLQLSNDDDACNLEVYRSLCPQPGDSGLPSTSSAQSRDSRDVSGISSVISEMISPTMMMETEEESDSSEDTIEETAHEDRHNIYEEVLNNEPTPCWMVTPSHGHGHAGRRVSAEKQKLSRTSKSVHGLHHCNNSYRTEQCHSYIQRTPTTTDYFLPPGHNKKPLSKKGTLSEKFSYLGYSVFGK